MTEATLMAAPSGVQPTIPSYAKSPTPEVEKLRHQVEVLSLEKQEAKLKARRLALMLSFAERENKILREVRHG